MSAPGRLTNPQAGPLYERVLHHICGQVAAGMWRPGEALPSERVLTQALKVSRVTIRRAIQEGVRQGLLHTVNGTGTYVTARAVHVGLSQVTPFPEAVRKAGGSPSVRFLSSNERTSDPISASALRLDAGDMAITMRLLMVSDDDPLSIIEATVPASWGRRIAERARQLAQKGMGFSLYHLYRRFEIELVTSDWTLEAGLADEEVSALLQTPLHAPVFLVHSLACDERGNPKEIRRTIFRGDRYRFSVRRAIHPEAF